MLISSYAFLKWFNTLYNPVEVTRSRVTKIPLEGINSCYYQEPHTANQNDDMTLNVKRR